MKTHIYKRETISLHETSPVKCSRFYITIYIYICGTMKLVQWLQYLRKISSAKPNDLFYTGSHVKL